MTRKRVSAEENGPKEPESEMLNVRVEKALMERFRRALFHTAPRRTQAGVVRSCIKETVEKLEKKHNGGKPFPPIPEEE